MRTKNVNHSNDTVNKVECGIGNFLSTLWVSIRVDWDRCYARSWSADSESQDQGGFGVSSPFLVNV